MGAVSAIAEAQTFSPPADRPARGPISRILSWEIIYLRSQPEGSGGQPSSAFLLGLAPARVCQAVSVTRNAGGLLHHRFTLARRETPSAVYSLWHFP